MMTAIASARPVSPAMTHSSIESPDPALVERLAEASREFDQTSPDPERNCWMAVHRHVHGVLPSEYDIREVPEDLYLAVLARRRSAGSGDG
jgi:hypothetical protein